VIESPQSDPRTDNTFVTIRQFLTWFVLYQLKKIKKAIPVTDHRGLYGCEMLMFPHCIDNQLTDGGRLVGPTHWPHSAAQKHYFSTSGTHFC
jgi:hypothetical protein